MNKIMLLVSSLFFAASVNAAGFNLITNGSFEDPDVKVGEWEVYDAVTGWSTIGAGIEIRDNVAGTAYIGDQFAELDSHGGMDTNSSIFQSVQTILGQSYLLSFAYSPRINKPIDTNGIEVFWNNESLASVSAKGESTHNWTVYEYIVTGTGTGTGTGSDVLQFSAIGADDTLGGSLDAISVSAVPIPAALFLFAPVLLGFIGLRRKSVLTPSRT